MTLTAINFSATVAAALKNIRTSLAQFGQDSGKKVEEGIISTIPELDPGVAVRFATF